MRKLLYGLAAVIAMGPLAAIAPAIAGVKHPALPAAHTAIRPDNGFDGNNEYFYNENWPSDCARIDSADALIIGDGDCTPFYGNGSGQLVDADNTSECLFYNSSSGIYDLAGCSSSSADTWSASSPSHTWSQWYTTLNYDSGNSMWADGTGTSHPLYASGMNGTDAQDHWTAEDCGC
jgi:hypothetical protein